MFKTVTKIYFHEPGSVIRVSIAIILINALQNFDGDSTTYCVVIFRVAARQSNFY